MRNPERIAAFVFILVGVLLQILILFPDLQLWTLFKDLWPILLILLGVTVLLKRRSASTVDNKKRTFHADEINVSHFMGEIVHRPHSTSYKGGESSLHIGSIVIDLRGVRCAEGTQKMSISLGIGSINLFLGEDIAYSIQAGVTVGEINRGGESFSGFAKRLAVHSKNYENAHSKMDLEISVMIGEIVLHGGRP